MGSWVVILIIIFIILLPNSNTGEQKEMKIKYRSKDRRYDFNFEFKNTGSFIEIYCKNPPSLRGRDSAVEKTHLYSSRKICFVSGKEPRTLSRAGNLAAQWAEYYNNYIKTGETAS